MGHGAVGTGLSLAARAPRWRPAARADLLRLGLRTLDVALFVLCGLLVADIASAIASAAFEPPPRAGAQPAPRIRKPATWADRQAIVERNLFELAVLEPAAPAPPPPVEIEETELPLVLLGTAAATGRTASQALVGNLETRKSRVVQVGDSLAGTAVVVQIERRRVVLEEGEALRELSLADRDEQRFYKPARHQARRSRRRTR